MEMGNNRLIKRTKSTNGYSIKCDHPLLKDPTPSPMWIKPFES